MEAVRRRSLRAFLSLESQLLVQERKHAIRVMTRCHGSATPASPRITADGLSLKDFIEKSAPAKPKEDCIPNALPPYLEQEKGNSPRTPQKVFIETYGCQMNYGDSEIVLSVLHNSKLYNQEEGDFLRTHDIDEANVILLMTCAVRENAEGKIFSRIDQLAPMKRQGRLKTIGILGCMAERLKEKLFDLRGHVVDVICGPDAYRDLPRLLDQATLSGQRGVNVMLSMDETYADIAPVRLEDNKKSAFVSIMRGCNNMCAFCIVPFTRGRERSRPLQSIVDEVRRLADSGVKEITLLGQNVNSYHDESMLAAVVPSAPASASEDGVVVSSSSATAASSPRRRRRAEEEGAEAVPMSRNFNTIYKTPLKTASSKRFVDLLEALSDVAPDTMRIRFTSPHPKDFPDGLLQLMKERNNICKQIHLPAQSGSSAVLEKMRRGYTREAYLELVNNIRGMMPNIAFSSDFIVGFCGETEEDHLQTLDLVKQVDFQMAYMFAYSLRPGTVAHRRYTDDVPEEVKQRRLRELIDLFYTQHAESTRNLLNQEAVVLVEGVSKKSKDFLTGKIDNGRTVVFPANELSFRADTMAGICAVRRRVPEVGDYVAVNLTDIRGTTPIGTPLFLQETLHIGGR